MIDQKQEQILLIFTTVVSLLTAWTWSDFTQTYIKTYFGKSLSTSFLIALVTTILLFMSISWIFRHLRYVNKNNEVIEEDITEIN